MEPPNPNPGENILETLSRTVSFFRNANLDGMSPIQRKDHQDRQMIAESLLAMHQDLEMRITRLEELLRGTRP
jgi:hypothetical protein